MAIKIRKKVKGQEEEEAPEVESDLEDGEEGSSGEDDASLLESEELPPEDSFVSSSVTAAKWMSEHKKKLFIAAGVIVALVVGYAIFDAVMKSRALERSKAVNDVVQVFPQYNEQEIAAFTGQGFTTKKDYSGEERPKKALELAEAAVANYGDTEVAGEANLLAGTAAQRLGDMQKAEGYLDASASSFEAGDPTKMFALQAKAALLVDQARLDDALATYQQIFDFDEKNFGAFALFEMARLHEKKGDTEKAADAYAKLLGSYETDKLYAPEAEKRLAILVTDGEERVNAYKSP